MGQLEVQSAHLHLLRKTWWTLELVDLLAVQFPTVIPVRFVRACKVERGLIVKDHPGIRRTIMRRNLWEYPDVDPYVGCWAPRWLTSFIPRMRHPPFYHEQERASLDPEIQKIRDLYGHLYEPYADYVIGEDLPPRLERECAEYTLFPIVAFYDKSWHLVSFLRCPTRDVPRCGRDPNQYAQSVSFTRRYPELILLKPRALQSTSPHYGLPSPVKRAIYCALRKHCVRWRGQGGFCPERPPGFLIDSYPQDQRQYMRDTERIQIQGIPQRELGIWPEDRLADKMREMPYVGIANHLDVEGSSYYP